MSTGITITEWPHLRGTLGGEKHLESFAELSDRFRSAPPYDGKDQHSGWSPAVFVSQKRSKKTCRKVTALALDYDGNSNATVAEALECWADTSGFLHTSKSHTAPVHRFRIVLELSRPITVDEQAKIWRWAERKAKAAGHRIDANAKDVARFWFAPADATTEEASKKINNELREKLSKEPEIRAYQPQDFPPYEHHRIDGKPIDVDRVLQQIVADTPRANRAQQNTSARGNTDGSRRWRTTNDAIAAVATAPEGERNATLNKAAYWCAQRDEDVREQLAEAARKAGLGDDEIDRTIDSGWTAGFDPRPIYHVSTDLKTMCDDAESAVASWRSSEDDQRFYRRGDAIVRVVRDEEPPPGMDREPQAPRLQEVPQETLREVVSTETRWVRTNAKGESNAIIPPKDVIATLAARPHYPRLAPLETITECPVLRPDGSLLDRPGYDRASGTLYLPNARYPEVPESPTKADLEKAIATLNDVLGDFPFETEEHRAAAFAAILTPLARAAFSGPAPLFLIEASAASAGKGLLAKVCAIGATGRAAASSQFTTKEDEMRKSITSIAIEGRQIHLWDNVSGTLGGDAMCSALTEAMWSDRLLGGNSMWAGPLRTTFFATGNNITIGADMYRRVCPIRLDPNVERPELREGFRHPRLLTRAREVAPSLVAAGHTILRAYIAAGRPDVGASTWGSYEEWAALVIGSLRFAGLPDPGDARNEYRERSDESLELLMQLVRGWARMVNEHGGPLKAKRALIMLNQCVHDWWTIDERDDFRDALTALTGTDTPSTRQLGKVLSKHAGQYVDGVRIMRCGKDGHGVWLWGTETRKAA